ncbi:MAG: hypothetical protein JRG68_02050 [Deltaproteobacteria bacterium]|nr:hypothetical protein [Deltaproteobacteria bacterium]MBW2099540.1 hypothetical protein [Deltaproteobacteria bacterium]
MKQKYLISKSDNKKNLIIKELAELDRGMFSVIYEETYDAEAIISAIEKGTEALVSDLRNHALYPVRFAVEKIAEVVADLYASDTQESIEILIDDMDFLGKKEIDEEEEIPEPVDEVESKPVKIDELLDDNPEDENHVKVDDDELKPIEPSPAPSLKVTSDDSFDVED